MRVRLKEIDAPEMLFDRYVKDRSLYAVQDIARTNV
jgi:hypothetical protein